MVARAAALYGEGQPIEPPAGLAHQGEVLLGPAYLQPGPLDEQLNGRVRGFRIVGEWQRRQGPDGLHVQRQALPTGDQHCEGGCRANQLFDERRERIEQVLRVV